MKILLGVLIDKILGVVVDYLKDVYDNYQMSKKVKSKVKEIKNEKDAVTRAKRLNDMLNS